MATRWKSTIDRILLFIRSNKRLILGSAGAALGVIAFIIISQLAYAYYLPTKKTWLLGILPNLSLCFGVWEIAEYILQGTYADWIPKDETFYREWKDKWRFQQKILIAIAAGALLVAFMMSRTSDFGYYQLNYSFMYLLLATAVLQCGVAEICVVRFMKARLDLLMEKMTEINRKNLEAAIEIERESIEKAAKSERLKVDLISNVSHDLKTPLTSMVGYIELIKKEELDDVVRDYADALSDKAEKLKEMIESLFSLAKASSGNIKVNLESISLNRLIEQILADMADHINNSGLHFVETLTDEDTHLISDNMHMYRICQNLIENAVKYSAKETRVFVKTYVSKVSNQEKVFLEITNTAGYLMDFEKEDIIERFSRGDKARSSDGNGLGLAIVSTYADALGGTFDISIDCDQFRATLSFDKEACQEPEQI